jgi:hypothetical protein
MADVKISALPAATTPVAGTEVLPIVQSGTTKKLTIADVTAGRAMSASSLTLTSPLGVASGGTGLAVGTSGGIPYYSSTTAITSSAALAANALVIGGGAGVAPSTTTTASGILTFLGTPSSANLAAAVTDETGTGALVFGTSPTFTTSAIFPAGTVGAPSITTTGDTNTGIYFPAADTIGFVEGGVESMRLDASGNLGVGNTSPSFRLDVASASNINQRIARFKPAGDVATIDLLRNVTIERSTNDSVLALGYATTPDAWVISASYGSTGAYRPLAFATSDTERARIDANGNIICGTAAIATNATNGFLYVPGCAGTPTGTPTTVTGRSPIVVDTTNNKLYFYSGGQWRDAGP